MARIKTTRHTEEWCYSRHDHEIRQLEGWQKTTHKQRLEWLEEAIKLAHKSGALPKK